MDEKQIKREVLLKASVDPDSYYPTETLRKLGFSRFKCSKCNRYFWSKKESNVCGDSQCSGGFRFIGKSPTKNKLDYIETWKEFSKIHKELGYMSIHRYPVVARWNPTTDFTIASIAAFQPYVVSGEIDPPANPLVIPQLVIRFPDIDNVGITGHFVCFIMLGQHAFMPPQEYNIDKYLQDHLKWLTKGMGVDINGLTIHEDVWAGGGNLGPSLEFFSHGLELSNQVYMQYEIQNDGSLRELSIKVLDMGQGYERVPWFTQGAVSCYETAFPPVIKKLRDITGVELNQSLMEKFTPLASYLNIDEVEDLDKAWQDVAKKMDMSVDKLKETILPNAALYGIAEHSRALLVAITDGALPSNVGGMYNLRVILRRALSFIENFDWNIDLADVCEWHAEYLKPLFPELSRNLKEVRAILNIEKQKFLETRKKTRELIPKLLEKDLSSEDFVTLYDSQGISPEQIKGEAEKIGKKIQIPDNFYALLSSRHEHNPETKTEREEHLPLESLPPTEVLYFDDYSHVVFDAKVLAIVDNFVVLDKSAFYPTSGGQLHDEGLIHNQKVVDVFKQGPYIVHVLDEKPKFHANDTVHCEVDLDRRIQLAQHHTATHIVNAAAKKVLGEHVNQASAKKDIDKAHLDITHYDSVDDHKLSLIEDESNKIVDRGIKTELFLMPRAEAEKKYGMLIYQGGAVPGRTLRIVKIGDIDVEACGGTHLNNTLDVGKIKMIKATKIQDGVVRLVFAAGKAAEVVEHSKQSILAKLGEVLDCDFDMIPGRVAELFKLWKSVKKKVKKKEDIPLFNLASTDKFEGDILKESATILKTQPDHVVKTVKRFIDDIKKASEK